jgi:microsomal prostaglandin-E synthase 2
MRRIMKGIAYGTTAGAAVGGYVYVATRPSSLYVKCEGPELSGEQWNALQDKDAVNRSFANIAALRNSGVVLNWLYGCPYCARVKAVLDFYDVPYTPIDVDPINFQELLPVPYRACPQLQLLSPPGGECKEVPKYPITAKGPFVADSEVIIQKIAGAAGADAISARVAARREWIGRDVARLIFVSGSKTYGRAYALMPIVTPSKYHNIVFRSGGAVPLWLLSKFKITARISEHYKTAADVPEGVMAAARSEPLDTDAILAAELSSFAGELKPFHGGVKPDLVDVELFGLLRSQIRHKPISDCVKRGGLDEWYTEMDRRVRSSAVTDRL